MSYPEVHEYCKHGICLLCQSCPDCEESIAAAKAIKELPYLWPDAAQLTGEATQPEGPTHKAGCPNRGRLLASECPFCREAERASSPRSAEAEQSIREVIKAGIEIAIVRGNLVPEDEDAREDFDMFELAEDAANAAFGVDACTDEPVPEVKELLAARHFSGGKGAAALTECINPMGCDHAELCLHDCDEGFVMDGKQQTPGKPCYDPKFKTRYVKPPAALSGGSEGPRCPKCGSRLYKVNFGLSAFAAQCKMCNHEWMGELTQFFRPISESNGEPKG